MLFLYFTRLNSPSPYTHSFARTMHALYFTLQPPFQLPFSFFSIWRISQFFTLSSHSPFGDSPFPFPPCAPPARSKIFKKTSFFCIFLFFFRFRKSWHEFCILPISEKVQRVSSSHSSRKSPFFRAADFPPVGLGHVPALFPSLRFLHLETAFHVATFFCLSELELYFSQKRRNYHEESGWQVCHRHRRR